MFTHIQKEFLKYLKVTIKEAEEYIENYNNRNFDFLKKSDFTLRVPLSTFFDLKHLSHCDYDNEILYPYMLCINKSFLRYYFGCSINWEHVYHESIQMFTHITFGKCINKRCPYIKYCYSKINKLIKILPAIPYGETVVVENYKIDGQEDIFHLMFFYKCEVNYISSDPLILSFGKRIKI